MYRRIVETKTKLKTYIAYTFGLYFVDILLKVGLDKCFVTYRIVFSLEVSKTQVFHLEIKL